MIRARANCPDLSLSLDPMFVCTFTKKNWLQLYLKEVGGCFFCKLCREIYQFFFPCLPRFVCSTFRVVGWSPGRLKGTRGEELVRSVSNFNEVDHCSLNWWRTKEWHTFWGRGWWKLYLGSEKIEEKGEKSFFSKWTSNKPALSFCNAKLFYILSDRIIFQCITIHIFTFELKFLKKSGIFGGRAFLFSNICSIAPREKIEAML